MNYLKRSLKYFEKLPIGIGSKQGIAFALKEIGCCLRKMEKYTEALSSLNKSLIIQESFSIKISSDHEKQLHIII